MHIRSFAVAVAGALFAGCLGSGAHSAPPPASAFGRLPAIQAAAISPDGQKVALLGGTQVQRIVSIAPIDGTSAANVDLGRAEISSVRWAGNDYVIVHATFLDKGKYMATGLDYAYRESRDFVLTTSGKLMGQLLRNDDASRLTTGLPILKIIDGPKPIAIVQGLDWTAANLSSTGSRFAVPNETSSALWRVDVASGSGRLLERGNPQTQAWAVDLSGEPRVRVDYDATAKVYRLMGRGKGDGAWKRLAEISGEDGVFDLLGYSDPEDAAYLREKQADGSVRVVRHDLGDAQVVVVETAKDADMAFDPFSGKPLAIIDEKGNHHWLDAEIGGAYEKLERALPGKTIGLDNWSRDRSRLVVRASAPDAPLTFYLLDTARGQLSLVGDTFPELKGAQLGQTRAYSYRARDGLEIPAYLTLPPGSTGKPPLIVLPHDGPASHDDDGFDWMTQFLATRGYAVLRPQFRGSTGVSAAFQSAGDHEWGGKMQADLLDGVADLAAKGLIDADKVCIIGSGYGGYAALAGVTFVGGPYRCAVAINGISDLPMLYGRLTRLYTPDSSNVVELKRRFGATASEVQTTAAISPAEQAAKGHAPVLLIASSGGTEDEPFEQTTAIRDALQRAGRPVETITLDNDDGLSSSESRTRALEAIEAFLARNLPVAGSGQPPPP